VHPLNPFLTLDIHPGILITERLSSASSRTVRSVLNAVLNTAEPDVIGNLIIKFNEGAQKVHFTENRSP
jgi:hypothetical protein